jgi:hypothetical protein
VLAVLVASGTAEPAAANWLTAIVRESAEVAGESSGRIAGVTSKLGPLAEAVANREGQTFTVGTSDEMSRVLPTLTPDALATGNVKLTLYLSEDSVFANRSALDQIPSDAELFVVTDSGAFPLTRIGKGTNQVLTAYPTTSSIRRASANGLRSIRGQTALVTGRVEDGKLIVTPVSAGEVKLEIDGLVAAARCHDVNLVILQSEVTSQAGGRNWLWQRVEVGGLRTAADAGTFGDAAASS